MLIGKVWIYRLLFLVVCVCVRACTVTDFSAEDKARGVKFCTMVYRHLKQGVSHLDPFLGTLLPRSPKSDESARMTHPKSSSALATRTIGICGYTAVPKCGHTCLFLYFFFVFFWCLVWCAHFILSTHADRQGMDASFTLLSIKRLGNVRTAPCSYGGKYFSVMNRLTFFSYRVLSEII